MTTRVIVTDAADLEAVLDALDRAAAPHGWRVRRPRDAADRQARARAAQSGLRLGGAVTVQLERDPDAAAATEPVDARLMLARTPVAGALADELRHPHRD